MHRHRASVQKKCDKAPNEQVEKGKQCDKAGKACDEKAEKACDKQAGSCCKKQATGQRRSNSLTLKIRKSCRKARLFCCYQNFIVLL